MPLQFKLPDIGEGVAEGEIVKWLVAEGDTVEEHQPVVEVMTDKATVEIPAPAAGRIARRLANEGDVVAVGTVIFEIETGAAGAAQPARAQAAPAEQRKAAPAASQKAPTAETQPASVGAARKPAAEEAHRPASVSSQKPASTAPAKPPAAQTSAPAKPAPAQPAAARGGKRLEFKLPDIGEGVAEGEVVKWLVQTGDAVVEHQAVVEVMTDKATVEIPAPAAGRIAELKVKPGEVVPVGQVLFVLEVASEQGAAAPAEVAVEAAAVASGRVGSLEGHAPAGKATREPDERPAVKQEGSKEPAAASAGAGPAARPGAEQRLAETEAGERPAPEEQAEIETNGKVLAVPSARRVARELGVDLTRVQGSGRNGIIRRADVERAARETETPAPAVPQRAAAQRGAPAAPARQPVSFAPGEREQRIPFRGVRRKIAEAMVRSKTTAMHFTVVEEVDVTDLVRLREAAKALGNEQGIKVTYMPFIMKAAALGLARYPSLNGHLDEAAGEIVRPAYVHLGIAMDTDNGLIVPVIPEVQAKGVLELAAELAELAERTRAGKVRPEELRGSTFSITNAGNIGGTLATPIINFPDIAILGVHRIVKRPGVVESPAGDRIEVRQFMNLSCSVDHRLADGADAARFLVHIKRLLENPGLLAL